MANTKYCVAVILLLFCLSILVLSLILGVMTVMPISSNLPTIVDTSTVAIGDILGSSSAISVNSSVSSVTISLTNSSSNLTADVYLSSIKPSENTEYLPHTTLTNSLSYSSSISINYLGADNPIYLLPGSKLLYNVSISSVKNTSKCPARLHLYNTFDSYISFSDSSPCLSIDSPTLWTVNINDSSSYYVRIEKNDEVNVTSVISVVRVYYNTTGLKTPDECSLLTSDRSSCTVTTCGICNRPDEYIIIKPTDNVVIQYEFTSTVNRGNACETAFECVFASLLGILFCCWLLVCCAFCAHMIRMFKEPDRHTTPRLREEMQTNNNVIVNNDIVTNFQHNNFNLQDYYPQFDDRSSTSSSEVVYSESECLLQKQQTLHINESPVKLPYLPFHIEVSSMSNTPNLQNDSSVVDDTVSLSVDLLDQDSSLSSVSLTCANMQFDNNAKQDQTTSFYSDYKMKYVTVTSEESKLSNHPKTFLIPNLQIVKGK